MRQFFLLIQASTVIFCLQSAFATETAAPITSIDEIMWAPTELSPEWLDNAITETYCSSSELKFIGCFAAVEKFAEYVVPDRELALRRSQVIFDGPKVKIEQFRTYQNYRRSKYKSYKLKFSKAAATSLVSMYQSLRKRLLNPKPYQVALSLNESFSIIFDPHKKYDPMSRFNGLNKKTILPGIGAELFNTQGNLSIGRVYVNSVAELAGLKLGDIITHANGKSIQLKQTEMAESALAFQDQELVSLRIKRASRVFNVKVQIGYYSYSPVVDRIMESSGKKYGYLYLSEITSKLKPEVECRIISEKILTRFQSSTEGMVLDLRDNVGGSIDTTACLAGLFMGKNLPIFILEDMSDITREIATYDQDATFKKKMVVLVNAATASSGELLASALQFHSRALILGDRTFGKSIVQIVEPYKEFRVDLRFTTHKFFRPDGVSYQSFGVIPDKFVFADGMTPNRIEKEALREEDIALFPLLLRDTKPVMERKAPLQVPACVSADEVKKNTDKLSDTDWKKDFQLQYALATLNCL